MVQENRNWNFRQVTHSSWNVTYLFLYIFCIVYFNFCWRIKNEYVYKIQKIIICLFLCEEDITHTNVGIYSILQIKQNLCRLGKWMPTELVITFYWMKIPWPLNQFGFSFFIPSLTNLSNFLFDERFDTTTGH